MSFLLAILPAALRRRRPAPPPLRQPPGLITQPWHRRPTRQP